MLEIPYGKETRTFNLKNNMRLTFKQENKKLSTLNGKDLHAEIFKQLQSPIGIENLNDRLDSNCKIAIVVDDITRPTPASDILAPLIEFLTITRSIPKENIIFIFALGVHRNMTMDEAELKLGKKIAGEYRWENHDCYNNLIYLGKTSRGTPVHVNKNYYEADLKISIGLIEPHLWAGYSGGAKGIVPGIAGVETIATHHRLVLKKGVKVGKIKNNPFREDLEECVDIIGIDLLLNVVLNSLREIHAVVVGKAREAYHKGVAISRKISECQVNNMADIIISSPNPLGIDFRQSSKAAFNTMGALKKKGVMIVISNCPDGKGNLKVSEKPPKRELIKFLAKILPGKMLMWVIKKQGFGIEDASGTYQMFRFIANYSYIFVSESLTLEDRKAIFVADHANSIEEALEMADRKLRKTNYDVHIYSSGGSTYPVINS